MSDNTIVHIRVRKTVFGKRPVLTPVLAPTVPSEVSRGFIQSPLQIRPRPLPYTSFTIHDELQCSRFCLKNNQHDVTCGLSFIFMQGAEHVGEREGYSKDYTLYQRLTVQEKWSPNDELPESSKHVENKWRLPMKIKDSPQVTSCWLFFKQLQWCTEQWM